MEISALFQDFKRAFAAPAASTAKSDRSIFWNMVRKEIISHILTLRFAVTFCLTLLLVFASFYFSTHEYLRDLEQSHALQRRSISEQEKTLKDCKTEQDKWDRIFTYRENIFPLPVPPLSIISKGLGSELPVSIGIRVDNKPWPVGYTGQSRAIAREDTFWGSLFGRPDFVNVVNIVLSLLAILFVFDAICGEKQDGTLRLALSYPIPRHWVLLSKWLGGMVVLFAPFWIAYLGGLGYAWKQGVLSLSTPNLAILFVLWITASLYVATFFSLGLLISAMSKKPNTALLVSLFAWVVWILVIPNIAPSLSRAISPAPSPKKIEAEKAQLEQEYILKHRRLAVTTGKAGDGSETRAASEALHNDVRRQLAEWDRFLIREVRKQSRVAEVIGRLSPSASWIYSAGALTNTGPSAYQNLLDAVRRLAKETNETYNDAYGQQKGNVFPTFSLDKVPRLQWILLPPQKAIQEALFDILLITILNVGLFLGAFAGFLRYDVR